MTTATTIGQLFGVMLVLTAVAGVCGRAEIARRIARWQGNRRRQRKVWEAMKGGL